MNKERKLIIAGNWKMNKTVAEALALVNDLKLELANMKEVDIVVCPPFTALESVSKAILDSKNIRLGAQNMSENNFGAFTGEICAGMFKEFSVRYVILGHCERRQYQKESDALIAKKAAAAHAATLKPIVCVGETLAEREAGQMRKSSGNAGARQPGRFDQGTDGRNHHRLRTGLGHRHRQDGDDATGAGCARVHPRGAGEIVRRSRRQKSPHSIRRQREAGATPRELMSQPDVDGALVGGAALEARSFADIIKNSI